MLSGLFLILFFGPEVLNQVQDRLVASGPFGSLDLEAASLAGSFFAFAVLLNFIPDYASLLETRWAIRWMGGTGRLLRLVVVDAFVTAIISLFFIGGFYAIAVAPSMGREFSGDATRARTPK